MKNKLRIAVAESKPNKFNERLMNGMSVELLDKAPEFLDAMFKNGVKNLNPNIPLEYKGWRKLTPREDFKNQFASSSSKDMVDLAKNTLYKVEYTFDFKGEEIKRIVLLPYVERGGVLYLSDAMYSVVPVLTEYVISATNKEVFVRLLKDKLIFKRIERNIVVNGQRKPIPVVVARAYKFTNDVNDKIPMALYLFVKYGFYGVFDKYFGTEPIITTREITEEDREKYTVFESTGVKPRILNDDNYHPHGIKILVEKDKVNPFMEIVIASLIYTFDILNVFALNIIDILNGKSRMTEEKFWRILLGKVIFRNKYTIDKILNNMEEYLNVIETYIDTLIHDKLKENGIIINDFYDLVAYVVENYNYLILNNESRSSSLNNRYFDVLYYILYEHIAGINRTFYGINKEYVKKGDKLAKKDIESLFNKHLSPKKVFSLIKSGGVNIALSPIDSSGDNYYYKISGILEDQNAGDGVKRSKQNAFPPSTRTLHAEDLLMGNILYFSKKRPSPRFRANPYLQINPDTGRVVMSDDDKRMIEKLESMLKHTFQDDKILESEHFEEIDGI